MSSETKLQRRLAAIVVADVAGYSRLMRLDEEGTFRRWRAHLSRAGAIIGEAGGRVVKTTGDGFVAEFTSVVEAMRGCLSWQGEIAHQEASISPDRRIAVRIGLHVGDVILGEGGDLFGDGVNMAARLEALAPPGGVALDAETRARLGSSQLDGYRDLGTHKLKNMGGAVRVWALLPAGSPRATLHRPTPWKVAIAAALALILAGGGWWVITGRIAAGLKSLEDGGRTQPADSRLSIVVMPFTNASSEPSDEVYSDAVTDELVTDLSRIADAFVISSNTSFSFKGKAVDARRVAQELRVRYVVTGTVRRQDEAVRVSASLLDGQTGGVIWSERYDRTRGNLRALQQDVTGQIARTLNLEMKQAASRRAERAAPASLDAQDYAIRAWAELWTKPQSKATNDAAIGFVARALSLEPTNPDAHASRCYALTRGARYGWIPGDARDILRDAVDAGEQAVALDPRDADAVFVLAFARATAGDLDRAKSLYGLAIELNPNHAPSFANSGYVEVLLGKPDDAYVWLDRAFAISPRDPLGAVWHSIMSLAALLAGDDMRALASAEKGMALNPNNPAPYLHAAVALERLGRLPDARAMMERHHAVRPDWTIAKQLASLKGSPKYDKLQDPVLAILRRLGLPEA